MSYLKRIVRILGGRIAKLLVFITSHLLFSYFALLLLLVNGKALSLSQTINLFYIAFALDSFLFIAKYIFTQNQCFKKLKNDIDNHRFGEIKRYDSDLTHKFIDAAKKLESDLYYYINKPNIAIYKATSIYNPTTYAINKRNAIIFIKNNFDDEEPINRYQLAHEVGHVFHATRRNKRYDAPIAHAIMALFILVNGLYFHDIGNLTILPLILYSAIVDIFNYTNEIESHADFTALRIIEELYGPAEMKSAANHLFLVRIRSANRNSYFKIHNNTFDSVGLLAHFLEYNEDKTESIESNNTICLKDIFDDSEISAIKDNPDKNQGIIRFANWVISKLQNSPNLDSTTQLNLIKNVYDYIFTGTSLIVTSYSIYSVFSKPENFDLLCRFLASPISLLVYSTFFIIAVILLLIYPKSWDKINSLITQNGL